MWSLILMNLWVIGQPVVIYLAALQEVPRQLYEAGSLDGMGPVRRFWHIALPAISPVVLFNVVYLTISCWQVFAIPYIMTEGGPDRATYFYSHYLYDNAFQFQRMGYASAMAWVQFAIILGLTALMFTRQPQAGAAGGAVMKQARAAADSRQNTEGSEVRADGEEEVQSAPFVSLCAASAASVFWPSQTRIRVCCCGPSCLKGRRSRHDRTQRRA